MSNKNVIFVYHLHMHAIQMHKLEVQTEFLTGMVQTHAKTISPLLKYNVLPTQRKFFHYYLYVPCYTQRSVYSWKCKGCIWDV